MREGKKVGPASNSELRRWFKNRCVVIDGEARDEDWPMPVELESFVLFPKHPVTLW